MSHEPGPQDDPLRDAPRQDPAATQDELLVAYLDGELDSGEARRVEELLSTDAAAREAVQRLDRTWNLLDSLDRAEVDERFSRTTLEMVAVAAVEDLHRQQATAPRRRRRRYLAGAAAIFAFGLGGFLAMAAFGPNPNRQLLEDLPMLENVDEYHQIDDVEFLRLLHQEKLFEPKENGDDA